MSRLATRVSRSLARDLLTLHATYGPDHLETDPVRYVHRYPDDEDREVVAFLSAALAFGRVAAIFRSLDDLLARLGPHPAERVRGLKPGERSDLLSGFRHRWIGEGTLGAALLVLGGLLREHGNLEAVFLAGDPGGQTLRGAVEAFAERARRQPGAKEERGFRFLFPTPATGSACKRMNLFLRWMVRPSDGVDLGLWHSLAPARLVIPLDTHVAFLGRALGLTRRRTPGWGMAEEITAALRHLDPDDPVKYDWSLSRLGILGHCPERRDPEICPTCPVYRHCRLG